MLFIYPSPPSGDMAAGFPPGFELHPKQPRSNTFRLLMGAPLHFFLFCERASLWSRRKGVARKKHRREWFPSRRSDLFSAQRPSFWTGQCLKFNRAYAYLPKSEGQGVRHLTKTILYYKNRGILCRTEFFFPGKAFLPVCKMSRKRKDELGKHLLKGAGKAFREF
jgi:hypothetical protein